MSFINSNEKSRVYAPGYFLAHEECTRVTKTIPQSMGTSVGNTKFVKAGTVFPSNDSGAVGIIYEDVDVSFGDMPGSVVTAGTVISARLPVEVAGAAKTALTGITFVDETDITRPW